MPDYRGSLFLFRSDGIFQTSDFRGQRTPSVIENLHLSH
nr:MAG TPA: hypothetical protein [Caudoviricetes sp.]